MSLPPVASVSSPLQIQVTAYDHRRRSINGQNYVRARAPTSLRLQVMTTFQVSARVSTCPTATAVSALALQPT
jgi:hypothetical protein